MRIHIFRQVLEFYLRKLFTCECPEGIKKPNIFGDLPPEIPPGFPSRVWSVEEKAPKNSNERRRGTRSFLPVESFHDHEL